MESLYDGLKRLGLDLVTFEGVKRSTAARTRSVTRTELITFCFHLSQLLKAGVNIIEALTDLRDTVDNAGFRQVLASLLEDIGGGLKLSEAMANHSYCFDNVFTALVRAGEQSGQLTEVLDELSENLKWQDEMASQAKRAMVYPIVVTVVIFAVIMVLMTVLVPQLAATFKTLVPKLPRETEILIALSNFFVKFWYLIIGVPVATIVFGYIFERAQRASTGPAPDGALRQKIILA
jgi:type IV pilus assembly protein PilC